ncbi:SH3 domain and tetratricopeptide repeat-containing protein 1 [Latimeria chalumnae]|uniref:SH3 domain and tetratricopeptide repeat-containing protein 1 n=1 Tax=Latimeria chalumnae TaxID=7897 RepID=UPI00313C9879
MELRAAGRKVFENGNFQLYTIDEERSSLFSCSSLKDGSVEKLQEESMEDQKRNAEMKPSGRGAAQGIPEARRAEEISVQKADSVKEGSVSSAAEDSFPTDIFLKLVMVRRKSGLPDSSLQEILRGKLRIVENDSKEVMLLFGELSARLLSIHSDQDLIVVTFKTFEEIWKFATYHSLGFVSHCMETVLLDQAFWLNCLEDDDDDAGIDVQINEQMLKLMYKGLLIQEGVGFCVATMNYEGAGPEELSFQCGDMIEIVGFLVACLQWFVGKHTTTGQTGFVKTTLVNPTDPILQFCRSHELRILDEEEKSFFTAHGDFTEEEAMNLLKQISRTDVSIVYRMDCLEVLKSHSNQNKENVNLICNGERAATKERVRKATSESGDHQVKNSHDEGKAETLESLTEALPTPEEKSKIQFLVGHGEENIGSEAFQSLLLFLNSKEYSIQFKNLYDLSFSFRSSVFCGYTEDEELIHYLELAREMARKKKMAWAQKRICFLLGRLCARKLKFSQARVYFEEAMGVVQGDFMDLFLLIAVYTNLTAIYIKQKNKDKYAPLFEKVAALLLGIPNYICSTEMESEILKYALKKAIFCQNQPAEARTCFLLARLHTHLNQYEEALPFLERLQLLNSKLFSQITSSALPYYYTLGNVYIQKCLPYLAVSCVKLASSQPYSTFINCLKSIDFVIENTPKFHSLGRRGQMIPTQITPCLKQALFLADSGGHQRFCKAICLSLSEIYKQLEMCEKAIFYLKKGMNTETYTSATEVIDAFISLAWLYILNNQDDLALDILQSMVEAKSLNSKPPYLGVVYNMSAISLRKMNSIKKAAEDYHSAIQISKEMGFKHNQAIAQANFGALCLYSKACCLAEHYLVKSVELFSELETVAHDPDFIQVLLWLGQYYVNKNQFEQGRFCYEWAFLVAIKGDHIESQLLATQLLCQFYTVVIPSEAQCIIYNEYQLSIARKMSDKELEGQVLETVSQLYLSLGTERAYKSALEYTKGSLGIFIDLRKKEKEAFAWLQAGKIYYILRQNELVDLYIQVAQDVAVSTTDINIALEVFEAAGDVFFNGTWDREKAVSFYRDRALPLAVKAGNTKAELRLYNKLVELLLNLKTYEEALEFAQAALTISVSLAEGHLNERVAYHRLANVYLSLGQYELAEHFFLKALSLCPSPLEFDEETLYYVKVYLILGDIIFYDLKDPYDAAGYYHLALAAAMDLGNKKAQLKICTRLATIYHNFLVDREMSLFFYQKARAFATDLNVRRINLSPDQYYKGITRPYLKNTT